MQTLPVTKETVSVVFEASFEARVASLVRRGRLSEDDADKLIVIFFDALANVREAR
jgi:hypothetical protein